MYAARPHLPTRALEPPRPPCPAFPAQIGNFNYKIPRSLEPLFESGPCLDRPVFFHVCRASTPYYPGTRTPPPPCPASFMYAARQHLTTRALEPPSTLAGFPGPAPFMYAVRPHLPTRALEPPIPPCPAFPSVNCYCKFKITSNMAS